MHSITHCTILGSYVGLARMATVITILYVYLFTNVVARVIYMYFCLGQLSDLLRSWFSRKRVRAQWFWAVSANARGQPPDPNSGFQSSASKTGHNKHLIFILGSYFLAGYLVEGLNFLASCSIYVWGLLYVFFAWESFQKLPRRGFPRKIVLAQWF